MAMLLPESAAEKAPEDVTVYVAGFGDHGAVAGLTALEDFVLPGLRAVSDFRSTTLKAHLRQADRLGCRFTLIIGDDEAAKGFGCSSRHGDESHSMMFTSPTLGLQIPSSPCRLLKPTFFGLTFS